MITISEPTTTRIGVWERARGSDHYERLPGAWHRWAQMPRFSAAPARKRVLLLGESIARGLFYDPVHTPATLIEDCLGADDTEVVDLARTGARLQHVIDTAQAARDLAPHAVVVLAGNNWRYELMDDGTRAARAAVEAALRRAGVAGVLAHREAALAGIAQRFVEQITGFFDDIAPVVFVLPESNLLDWQPATITPVLGAGRDHQRHRLATQLRAAARAGEWDTVPNYCDALHDLDGGLSDEAHRYRARAALHAGNVTDALTSFRRARDVRLWYDGGDPSWLPSIGVTSARQAASERGAWVVDLTEIFPSHAASGIPDRSLFLDFCHCNAAALNLIAVEVAHSLGPILGLPTPRDELEAALPTLPGEVESGAQFGAAMVNADFAQPVESVAFHTRAAVEAAASITTAMAAFTAAPASPAPWWIRPTELSELPNVQRFIHGVGLTGRYRYDEILVSAFNAELERIDGGQVPAVRPDRALPANTRTDLLDPMFAPSWRPVDWEGLLGSGGSATAGAATAHRHYYRAHTDLTTFTFMVVEPATLHLDLALRLGTAGRCRADLQLNGVPLERMQLGERWLRWQVQAGPDAVRPGVNHLELRWERDSLETTPLHVLANRIEQGIAPELTVVFGEIHSLHATLASPPHSPHVSHRH